MPDGRPLDPAVLASLASSIEDLSRRVTELADSLGASPREDAAAVLYDVERHLAAASRRMAVLVGRR
ncbi:MAG: hypothetical protein AB7L84_07470 [Acidimicrobiia bacterium]